MRTWIEVSNENLLHIDFQSIIAITAACEGAMGEPGGIEFSTADGTWYHFNYVYGPISIKQFQKAFPESPLSAPDLPDGWHVFYLGAGNSLFLHDQAYQKYLQTNRSGDPEDIMLWWRSTLGTPLLSKKEHYAWLVSRVKRSYPATPGTTTDLVWCEACQDEINLWTYWQGRGHLNPEFLVVGQDWGSPDSPVGRVCLHNIANHSPYLEGNNFPSDQNLLILFRDALGIDISVPNEKLFFTNLILGYRTGNNTGPLKASHFAHDLSYFKSLVCLLRPKIVICLGQNTFTYALSAFGEKKSFPKGYTAALEGHDNYVDIAGIRFYGMSHCGNYGCKNRGGTVTKGLALQIEDWKQIVKNGRP